LEIGAPTVAVFLPFKEWIKNNSEARFHMGSIRLRHGLWFSILILLNLVVGQKRKVT
jgi:hypothetical protein